MMKWLPLILGGSAGTLLRYFISGNVAYRFSGHSFPYGTFAVNLLGCFLLGLFYVAADVSTKMSPMVKLFLTVGFCGAFTTFSTFMFEVSQLIRGGESLKAFSYLLLSVVLGFFFLRGGLWIGDLIYE